MLTTLLAFLATLGLLIVVHEYGHYKVARWCGVRVLRFSIGFGRVLWRHQAHPGATEFTLAAWPLGGYVRMLDSREGTVPSAWAGEAFDRQPLRSRVAIVAAGPLANLGLAVLLYAAMHWWGVEEPAARLSQPPAASALARAGLASGDRVTAWALESADHAGAVPEWQDVVVMADLRWALADALMDGQALWLRVDVAGGAKGAERRVDLSPWAGRSPDDAVLREVGLLPAHAEPVIAEVLPGGVAQSAGVQAGDRVRSIDGQPVPDAVDLRERVRQWAQGPRQTMAWVVERHGAPVEVAVRPRVLEEAGVTRGRIDAMIGQAPERVFYRLGPWEGLERGVQRTWDASVMTLRMIGRMVVGQASVRQLSGPLSIAEGAGQSARAGMAQFLGFLALVSVSLGVLNLLPLPMLDGGHLLYYLFEGVTGRPVPERWLARLQRGGIMLLLLLMFVALSNDVSRLLGSP